MRVEKGNRARGQRGSTSVAASKLQLMSRVFKPLARLRRAMLLLKLLKGLGYGSPIRGVGQLLEPLVTGRDAPCSGVKMNTALDLLNAREIIVFS